MVTQKIVAQPPRSSVFLVLTIRPGAETAVRALLPEVSGLTRSVSFRHPADSLMNVVGIGSGAWDRLFPGAAKPAGLHEFIELDGGRHRAPSTPGDLFFHIRGGSTDLCFELARVLMQRFGPCTEVADEVQAFRYFDQRDVLGFVDGTENPEDEEAHEAVLVSGDGPFDGGSYVIVQKYLHDMAAWEATSTEEQERIIGRTKADDLELPDEVKPANSHIAVNDVSDPEGNDLEILRYNMVFGSFAEPQMGTYFVGYAKDPGITELMLENMFLGRPRGNYDRILDFSTAQTGGLFYVPPVQLLDGIQDLAPRAGTQEAPTGTAPVFSPVEAAADQDPVSSPGSAEDPGAVEQREEQRCRSLGIGSLRGK